MASKAVAFFLCGFLRGGNMPDIDNLNIRITANATTANNAIEKLNKNITALSHSMSSLSTTGLGNFTAGLNMLTKSMQNFRDSGVKTQDFTRLQKNVNALASIDSAKLSSVASGLNAVNTAFSGIGNVNSNSMQISNLATSIAKLGYKGVDNAIANIPRLGKAMSDLFATLAQAPAVNQNIVDMTNALANLASQGGKVGTASSTVVRNFDGFSKTAGTARNSAFSLASMFGKLYASYFMVIRGVKALSNSIETSMNYVETYNYFNVTMKKIGKDFAALNGQFGSDSAEAYADEFSKRLSELSTKMTGYVLGASGELVESGVLGLGVDPQQLMQFQARIGAITNSVGLVGEASIDTSKALSMLSADISSLTNMDLSQVMTSLSSGLIGQSRALYKFGIDITNNTLKQYAYAEGIEKAVSEMSQAEKMQLRLLAILDQSKVAWGDQANTLNSVANQYRVLSQQWQNLSRTLGNLFLPIVQKALPVVNGLVISINRLFTALGFSLYGDTWLADLQDGISGGAYDDGFESLEEDVDGATEALEKFKKSARGFDELNIIGTQPNLSKDVLGIGQIDLSAQISASLQEYESVWEKSFANLESEAQKFADAFTEKLNIEKIAENIKAFADSAKNLYENLKPLGEGLLKGFFDTLEKAKDISLKLLTDGMNVLSSVLGIFPEQTLETVGEHLGEIVAHLLLLKTASSFLSTIDKLGGKVSGFFGGIGGVLNKFPLLLGIGGIVTGLAALKEIVSGDVYESFKGLRDLEERFSSLDSDIDSSLANISNLKNKFSEINNGGQIKNLYNEWSQLNKKALQTGTLTDTDKAKLETYANELIAQVPELSGMIDSHGMAYAGLSDDIDSVIQKQIELYKVEGYKSLMVDAFEQEAKATLELNKAYEMLAGEKSIIQEAFGGLNNVQMMNFNKLLEDGVSSLYAARELFKMSNLTRDPLEALFNGKKFSDSMPIMNEAIDMVDKYKEALETVSKAHDAVRQSARLSEETTTEYNKALKKISAANVTEQYKAIGKTMENEAKGISLSIEKPFVEAKTSIASQAAVLQKEAGKTGNAILDGFIRPIELGGGTEKAMKNFGQSAIGYLKNTLMIKSPSRVTQEIGEYFVDGFNNGITSKMESTFEIIRQYAAKISDEFSKIVVPQYEAARLSTPTSSTTVFESTRAAVNQHTSKTVSTATTSSSNNSETNALLNQILKAVSQNKAVSVEVDGKQIFNVVQKQNNQAKAANRVSFSTQ